MPNSGKLGTRSASDVIRAGCTESLVALKKYHRRALKLEAEPIHQIRVGTRRLRAALRIFADLMDEQWARELEAELRWLAHLLGAVRDLDVLRERLRQDVDPEDRRAMIHVQRILAGRHRDAQAAMKEGLQSERYSELVERLHAGTLAPQLMTGAGAPALESLMPMLSDAWKKLARNGNKLSFNDDSLRYHHVRKSAKHVRYASEMLEEDLESKDRRNSEKFIDHMKELQNLLGELQDSVVAAQTLERLMELHPGHKAGIQSLIEAQGRAEKKARGNFPKAWSRAKEKEFRKWMHG